MRRSKAEQVGDIVLMFMRQEGLEGPYNEYKLLKSWDEVLGEGISRFTGEKFIKNQTLFVQILSPVIKQELLMTKSSLVHKLNDKVGSQVINDIRFY